MQKLVMKADYHNAPTSISFHQFKTSEGRLFPSHVRYRLKGRVGRDGGCYIPDGHESTWILMSKRPW